MRRAALLALLIIACGCRREPQRDVERLAILRFENSTGNPEYDWVARTVQGVIASELAGSTKITAAPAESLRDVPAYRATQVLHGVFSYHRDKVKLRAYVRETAGRRTVRTIDAEGGALQAADTLARQLSSQVLPFHTRSAAAARLFFDAAGLPDHARAIEGLEQAIAADPSFEEAYVALAQRYVATGNSDGHTRLAGEAAKRGFSELTRMRLRLLDNAGCAGPDCRTAALQRIARYMPAREEVWLSLAEAHLQANETAKAVESSQTALRLAPNSPAAVRTHAFARAAAGNVQEALADVQRYVTEHPNETAVGSLPADVAVIGRRFGEAAGLYVEAARRDPQTAAADLYRAALARHLAGNTAAADQAFAAYLQMRKAQGDGLLALREAVWEASTGRADRARTRLASVLAGEKNPDVKALAEAQIAFLDLAAGRTASAPKTASSNPQVRVLAAAAALLAQPPAPRATWEARIAALKAPRAASDELLGYALLFSRDYAGAAAIWEQIARSVPFAQAGTPLVLAAWARRQAGQSSTTVRVAPPLPLSPEPGLGFLGILRYQDIARV